MQFGGWSGGGSRRRYSRQGVVVGLALALGILSGCSSNKAASPTSTTTTSSPTTTRATTTTSTTQAATTTTPGTTTATIPPPPPPPTPCVSGRLSVAENGSSGALGTIQLGFGISNTGSPCTLYGYPTVVLKGKSGVIAAVVSHSGEGTAFTGPPGRVVVVSGSSAAFVLQYSDVQTNGQVTCPSVTSIEVTLPGTTTPLAVGAHLMPCGAPNIAVSAVESATKEHAEFAG